MKTVARFVVVAVAAVLCGAAIVRYAWRPFDCLRQTTLMTVRTDAASQATNEYERTVRARNNLGVLGDLHARCMPDVRVALLTGANLELLGRFEEALASYQEALTADQRPEIYAAIGDMQVRLGRTDAAIESYVAASRFNRNMYDSIHSEYVLQEVRRRLDAEQ